MKKTFTLLISIFMLTSCYTAYYNIFFNAKKYYEEAEEMGFDDNGRPSSQAVQKYDEAIKRCGVVLTEYQKSKYVDDALFLLGKSIFYKGRNYFNAIEKFEDLIATYPESEFCAESYLFLAKSKYILNQKDEAFKILNDFIQNDDYSDYHPDALMLLSDYHVKAKEYINATFYLEQVLENYPKSDEYPIAFFRLGKIYHDQEEYSLSNDVFNDLLESRNKRNLKYDARYYIALNEYLLGNLERSDKDVKWLLKKEYRENEIPKLNLLKARILASKSELKRAETLFLNLIEDNKSNKKFVAKVSYYLAEMYFTRMMDYEKSIEFYDEVKKKDSESDLIEQAVARSAVASKILQFRNPDRNLSIDKLVNEQLELADYYLDILELPDSALVVYDNIESNYSLLLEKRDDLLASIDTQFLNDSLNINLADSTLSDSVQVVVSSDSISIELEHTEDYIYEYETNYLPFTKFLRIWVYNDIKHDQEKASILYEELKQDFPEDFYTSAADKLLSGVPLSVITDKKEEYSNIYDKIVRNIIENPQITITKLDSLKNICPDFLLPKINYTIGFTYYFDLDDSTSAKPYFDNLIADSEENDYTENVKSFYENGHFKKIDRLPYLDFLENKELEEQKEKDLENQELESDENKNESDDEIEIEIDIDEDEPEIENKKDVQTENTEPDNQKIEDNKSPDLKKE